MPVTVTIPRDGTVPVCSTDASLGRALTGGSEMAKGAASGPGTVPGASGTPECLPGAVLIVLAKRRVGD